MGDAARLHDLGMILVSCGCVTLIFVTAAALLLLSRR